MTPSNQEVVPEHELADSNNKLVAANINAINVNEIKKEVNKNENIIETEKLPQLPNNSFLIKQFGEGYKDEALFLAKNSIPLVKKTKYVRNTCLIILIIFFKILSTLTQFLLTMMSIFFCGHLGPQELAAVALSNTFISIGVFSVINGFSSACDTFFPQLFGGNNKKKLGIVFQKGIMGF